MTKHDIGIGMGLVPTGHFRIEKRRHDGTLTWETEFNNLVLDIGFSNLMDRLGDTDDINPEYLYLGTGTSEPSRADTGLESVSGTLPGKKWAISTPVGNYNPGVEIYSQVDMQFDYSEGEAEGVWTELGLAFGSTYSLPYNRSLIRDDVGNAISLTVLSDEFLTVYVSLRMHAPASPVAGSTTLNGSPIGFSLETNEGFTNDSPRVFHKSFWVGNFPVHSVGYFSPGDYPGSFNLFSSSTRTLLPAEGVSWDVVINPGSSIDIEALTFIMAVGSSQRCFDIRFDSPINKPADHKMTLTCSLKFYRAD